MRKLPTPFHLNALWTAIAAVSITLTVAIVVGVIFLGTQIIGFLQPILVPFAVAGVLAYLLDPLVAWLMRRGLSRERSVWTVFLVATLMVVGVGVIVIGTLREQWPRFQEVVPGLVEKARTNVSEFAVHLHDKLKKDYDIEILDYLGTTKETDPSATPGQMGPPLPVNATAPEGTAPAPSPASGEKDVIKDFDLNELLSGAWIKQAVPRVASTVWTFIRNSVGGFLGVFGFLLSFVIVPLYLYYFLTESAVIKERWSEYVPLRESRFRDEVVGTLTEINGYLVAFFRGQLVVSLINGLATGLGLTIIGLEFGWLIGLSMCALGMIPYVGILLAWIPAVLIASVQGGAGTWITDDPWWIFPLVVTGIFVVVQQIDGLFITPRIVGESVGLHPMTVILSLFGWGLVLGGLLGAILGVPLTACLKVLFQRYVWTKAAAVVQTGPLVGNEPPSVPSSAA
jgi:predicted PurR-regulated permease PerM